jgi:hypothetical protein
MKKRISKRRWKARAAAGREITRLAIIEHDLTRWFVFVPASELNETYVAVWP